MGDKKACLVAVGALGRYLRPLRIAEVKRRVYTRIGPSYASVARRAMSYARQLDSMYLTMYDGWVLLFLSAIYPNLLRAYHTLLGRLNEPAVSGLPGGAIML